MILRGAGARVAVAIVLATVVLALSGCTVAGSVVVRSPELVVVDLTWTPPPSTAAVRTGVDGCLLDSTTVTTLDFSRQVSSDGTWVCRVTGHARLADLQRWFGLARQVDDRAQVEFFPAGRVPDAVAEYQLRQFVGLDVTVTFPGPVTDHLGGAVQGSSVRFADLAEFVRNRGLSASGPARAVVEPHAVPAWVLPGGCALGGVVVGAVWGLWWGRRRALRPPRAVPEQDWSHD